MTDLVPRNNPELPDQQRNFRQQPEREPGYPAADTGRSEGLDLREVLLVLRRNWMWVAGITLLFTGVVAYIAYTQPPIYRAKAVMRLQNERQAVAGPIAGPNLEQMLGRTADPLLSEMQVLRSRRVVGEVAQRLGLQMLSLTRDISAADMQVISVDDGAWPDTLNFVFSREGFTARSGEGTAQGEYAQPFTFNGVTIVVPERPDVQEAAFRVLSPTAAESRVLGGLSARPIERTDVVEVEYTAGDPDLALAVVNTAVDVFQSISVERTLEAARRRRMFIEDQLERTDSLLAAAQLGLSDFRTREEVLSSRDQFAAQQSGMMDLEVRREEINANRRMFRSLVAGIDSDLDGSRIRTLVSSPQLSQNPVVAQAWTQMTAYQARRDSLTAGEYARAPTAPEVRRMDALIAGARSQIRDAVLSHIASMDAQVAALDTMRARSASQIRGLPEKEAEEMRLVQRVESTRRVADQLREEYQRARIAEAVELGQVEILDRAVRPGSPVGTGRPLKLALGFMMGLAFGGGFAFLKEGLNTAIRGKDDVERHLGAAVLAVIPRSDPNQVRGQARTKLPAFMRRETGKAVSVARPLEELITVSDLRSSGAEAYRTLRTNLIFSAVSSGLRRIVITSPFAAEGKTTTASNLAVTYAQQGLKVLLIDGDLRKARLHRVFGLVREPGLTELVMGTVQQAQAIQPSQVAGLSILTSGTLPPNPSELLGGSRMRKVLESFDEQYDVVLIDAPPVLVAADVAVLSKFADGVVVVVRAGKTERRAAQAALGQLQAVGSRIVGVVLNDPDAKISGHDGGYYYAYSYYGDETE